MGNASSVDNQSNLLSTCNRIDFQDIDKVDPTVLQYLLNQEIEANQKIEDSINSEREIPQIKLLLLGAQWGRNVFINCCKFMFSGPVPVEIRVECLPKLRWRIVSQINRLLTKIPREKLSELEGHMISLSEYPSPETELTPSFLNQTKSAITTLWLHTTIQAEFHAQRWSSTIDPLFTHVIQNAEKIFGTEFYIPGDTEIFFAKSEDTTDGVVETEFQILLPQKFKFRLTDLSHVDARRKKVLDQFDSVNGILFFVDMLDDYSRNGILPEIFSEIVNSKVLKNKPVMILGYNNEAAEELVKEGFYPNLEEISKLTIQPFLEKRSDQVHIRYVDASKADAVKEILNGAVSIVKLVV